MPLGYMLPQHQPLRQQRSGRQAAVFYNNGHIILRMDFDIMVYILDNRCFHKQSSSSALVSAASLARRRWLCFINLQFHPLDIADNEQIRQGSQQSHRADKNQRPVKGLRHI